MKCGNCKEDHASALEVKACYGMVPGSVATLTRPAPQRSSTTTTTQNLRALVPAGHYATPSRTGNNDLDFWRIDKPEQGKWKGYTFVKRVIGGNADTNVRGGESMAALKAIVDSGVKESAVRYGQEIGQCYRCNRHLTDETSRALGIGPECRKRGF